MIVLKRIAVGIRSPSKGCLDGLHGGGMASQQLAKPAFNDQLPNFYQFMEYSAG